MKYGIKCDFRTFHTGNDSDSIYFVFEDASNYWIVGHKTVYYDFAYISNFARFFREYTIGVSAGCFIVRLFEIYTARITV